MESTASQLKDEGNAFFKAGRYAEAVISYSNAIQLDSSNAVLFSNRSAAYLGDGLFGSALADAERAIAADPGFTKGYMRKAKALRALGRPAHAEATLREALDSHPSDAVLVTALADFLKEEDGTQSILLGIMPGSPAQNMRDKQANEGMAMHTNSYIMKLPSEAHQQAFLGNAAAFRAAFDPPKHANLRSWSLNLPLTTLIVSGAQRVHLVAPSLNPGNEHKVILSEVLANGWCRVEAKDIGGMTAFKHATGHHPRLELAKVLAEHGADPNSKSRMGEPPIFSAIMAHELDAVKLLLDAGADPKASDMHGISAEQLAIRFPEAMALLHAKMGKHQENKSMVKGEACSHCGTPGATRRCGSCRVALYCSRDCQRNDWKVHKKTCSQAVEEPNGGVGTSTGGVLRVKVHGCKDRHAVTIPISRIAQLAAHKAGLRDEDPGLLSENAFSLNEERAASATDKNMAVKIQVQYTLPAGSGDMMVYNRTRSFHAVISIKSPDALKLDRLIREKGINGQKGYFMAFMEKKGELTVIADKMLPTQPW